MGRRSMLRWELNAKKREKKQRLSHEMAIARPILLERSGGACEAACSESCTPDRRLPGTQAHHVRMRSQGGNNDPLNLMWVCVFCHSHIHHNPAESYDRGFLKRSGA